MDDTIIEVYAGHKGDALQLVRDHAGDFRDDFALWLDYNWPIFEQFERMALEIARKRPHYSAKTLFEVLRHHSILAERASRWKLNNVFTADCARLFGLLHPNQSQLFSTRRRLATA